MSRELQLSIAIVNYRSGDALHALFESLRAHPVAASHEWIVVDNSPGDGVAEWLAQEHPEVRLITSPGNVGYARAVNAAIEARRGEHLLVLNPDVELGEGGIDRALEYLRAHPECGLVGAKLLNSDGSVQRSARRFYRPSTILLRRTPLGRLFPDHPELRSHLMLDDDLSRPRPVDWVMGAWMLVRGDAIETVGPMDGRYFLYLEDVDWCYRMWESGYEVHYFPEVEFVHQYRRSSVRGGRTAMYHLRSFLSFNEKWGALIYVAKRLRGAMTLASALLSDVLAFNLAFVAAFLTRRFMDPVFGERLFDFVDYMPLLLYSNAVSLIALPLLGRYRGHAPLRRWSRWLESIRAAGIIALVVMAGTYLAHTQTFSRAVLVLLLPYLVLALELLRPLRARALVGGARARGVVPRVALLGDATAVGELAEGLATAATAPLVAGAILDTPSTTALRLLGTVQDAASIVDRYRIDEVLVAGRGDASDELTVSARELAALGLRVYVDHPWLAISGGQEPEQLYGRTWARVESPAACGDRAWTKFVIDRPVALLLCLFSLPFFVLCSLLGRPLGLVRTREVARIGRRQRQLRWMELVFRHGGRALPGICQLPLFAQVLTGHMSLVGPYPLPSGCTEDLGPIRRLRFAVNPGLTGFWQRELDKHSVQQLVEDDLDYLERWSLSLDLDLFLSTLPQLLGGRDRWHIRVESS